MHFSNAAIFLLGALQPTLAKPTLLHRTGDGSQNKIVSQWQTATETVIDFLAPNPGCGSTKPWVGIWPVDAGNPYWAEYKAWQYVEPTSGFDIRTVKFNNAKLGIGEYKAAFVCEDGRRSPWMVSKTFKVDAAPPKEKGQCVYRRSIYNNAWTYIACDKVSNNLCYDCGFGGHCNACSDCQDQCGLPKDY
ncbi:hypothetical protein BM221_010242 [Beauveria bassiana]|uniref:Uncharacterized protein n=1 Tax=Beauveria bassiana TaxID=176275 RepID=A0A2N6N9X0_BEABA|nr:hypothetical protein BM221_010242 [Beauveria bassiana]